MKHLAVVGHPVSHSRSPAMQTAALESVGLGGEWTYGAIDVPPQDLPAKIADLAKEGYVGVNVTIPHKEAALLVAARASDRARAIGAANTLTFHDDGIEAENTDGPGILAAIGDAAGRALVLGAGGSARAAVWALKEAGNEVAVWNRSARRAEAVAADLGVLTDPSPEITSYDVIVNTTPIGLGMSESPDPALAPSLKDLPLSADGLSDRQVVVDLAYGSVETPVIAAAKAAGARWIDGLEVLVRQGAESFRIWTGIDPPLDVMRRAARAGRTDHDERAPDTPDSGSAGG